VNVLLRVFRYIVKCFVLTYFKLMATDPTKTKVIRQQWITQFNVRYRKLKGDINRFILHGQTTVTNQAFEFGTSAQAVLEFLAFLQTQIDDRIFDNALVPGDMWQNQYIERAYTRGVHVGAIELRRQGITDIPQAIQGVSIAQVVGTATPSLGAAFVPITNPIHLDAIQLIYTRDFVALQGITNEMSKQIARVLTDGIEQGFGAAKLAKLINDRVDKIGVTRSRLMARTETVRAYNVAKINESVILSAETGVDIMQEWVTSGDERVRNTHAHRNGVIYTDEQARALIGEPNCRCALVPHIESLDDPKERTERRVAGLANIS